MAIASMTGFAREAGTTGPFRWAWEFRTVNGRGLDVRMRVPPGHEARGEEARQAIARVLGRGTCHAGLTLSRAEAEPAIRINEEALEAVIAAVSRLRLPDGIRPVSLDGLIGLRGILEVVEGEEDEALEEALATDLRAGLDRALEALVAMRRDEGAALARVLVDQLERIERLTAAADASPARRPEAIRARIAEQVALILDNQHGLDPQRLHQEAVLIAARADIREELDRLKAHIAAARALIAEGGQVGRRLDFLAQELSREANTLCAKANDVSLTAIGLDLKAVVEQFREQVQNVE